MSKNLKQVEYIVKTRHKMLGVGERRGSLTPRKTVRIKSPRPSISKEAKSDATGKYDSRSTLTPLSSARSSRSSMSPNT